MKERIEKIYKFYAQYYEGHSPDILNKFEIKFVEAINLIKDLSEENQIQHKTMCQNGILYKEMSERNAKYATEVWKLHATIKDIQTLYLKMEKNLRITVEALEFYADKSMWSSSNEFDGNSWQEAQQALSTIRGK